MLFFYHSTFAIPYQNKSAFFQGFMGDNDEAYASNLPKAMLEEIDKMVLRLKSQKHG